MGILVCSGTRRGQFRVGRASSPCDGLLSTATDLGDQLTEVIGLFLAPIAGQIILPVVPHATRPALCLLLVRHAGLADLPFGQVSSANFLLRDFDSEVAVLAGIERLFASKQRRV